MKELAKIAVVLLTLFLCSNVIAQMPPPPPGGWCTNCPPYTNNYTPPPYVPGLKLSVSPLSGTNLFLNLLEADPAGKYDIYFESNLVSSSWSDVIQGTSGQTNFALTFSESDMGFFKAARTDTPITNAANVTFSFQNLFVNTNLIMASVDGGPAAAMAVLVNNTNFADARLIPFSAVPYVLLGTNDGVYQVWFGFQGSDGTDYWSMATVTLDTTPPLLVFTGPTNNTVSQPMIQLQGYSTEALSRISYDITNAVGSMANQRIFITSQYTDTNTWIFTTNYFQGFDIPLTNGVNTITLHATDLAGNTTITNINFTLDYSGATNPPLVQITWPQNGSQISGTNFTLDGQLDDPTATVSASITDSNGDTNIVSGLVGRDGKFWVENLSLSAGTNALMLTVKDAAGNTSVTNISVVQSALTLTMNPVTPDSQLWQPTVNLTGTISDTSYAVWVNGIKGTNNGDGTWSASNVPTTSGGTASFTITAYAPSEQQPDGSYGN
jgi:hypothetical protein